MNLFLTRLTGKMMDTEKFEAHVHQMVKDLARYHKVENSSEYKEFLELEKIEGALPELPKKGFFTSAKAYAKQLAEINPEQLAKRQRLEALRNSDDISFYLSQDKNYIHYIETFKESYRMTGKEANPAAAGLKPGYHFANPNVKTNISYPNERQANNNGKNCHIANDVLYVNVKKETTMAPCWDEKKGFVMKEYAYTGDVLNTADAFCQAEGLFMVKLRFKGAAQQAVTLQSDSKLPLVRLFHFNGRQIMVGINTEHGTEEMSLNGLKANEYYVFSFLWKKDELLWMVNDHTVFQVQNTRKLYDTPMYLQIQSFIAETQKHAGESVLDIDWIRCFVK